MKRLLTVLMCVAVAGLFASTTSAAPVCTVGDAIWLVGLDQSYSCQLGNLVFDNFNVLNNGGDPTPTVTVANPLQIGDTTLFSFNPHLGSNMDIDFYFTVTVLSGTIDTVDLSVGGHSGAVSELLCTNTILGNPGNNCPPTGTQLASLSNSSGIANVTVPLSSPSSFFYVFKDVGTQPGGALSTVTESFTGVPEPMTLSLMGAGLLGIGLWGRRLRRK